MERPKNPPKQQLQFSHKTINCRLNIYQQQVHTVFHELIHKAWGTYEWEPDVDVCETEQTFIIKIDIPGVTSQNLSVSTGNNQLIVEGSRQVQTPPDCQPHLTERPQGSFCRVFEFDQDLDETQLDIQNNNGVLTIKFNKD